MKNIVYALESPHDGLTYYVGMSQNGLKRPYSHTKSSHSDELKQWINGLGREPIVKILEREVDNLRARETYWINEFKKRNAPLINKMMPTEKQLKYADYKVGEFIKERRKMLKITQKEFAERSGLGLRFVREIEQGKETCRMDKVLQALALFGATMIPVVNY
jgi:y4mF family transcriptional regulator